MAARRAAAAGEAAASRVRGNARETNRTSCGGMVCWR